MSHENAVTGAAIVGLFAGWFLRWLTDLLLERRWIDRLTRKLPCHTASDDALGEPGKGG